MASRYKAEALTAYARALLEKAGLEAAKAAVVAHVLVEGDLLGHDTHGLALLAAYLGAIEDGSMNCSGDPEVIGERSAVVTWDGRRLPGPWLTLRALDEAARRARIHGTGTVVIRRSHHIACLAAYLLRATEQGLMLLLISSGPDTASVAPHGGTRGIYTPNPLAAGIPTSTLPILVDISASITTNGMTARLHKEGKRFEHDWLIDSKGNPTSDPSVLFTEPKGTLLPLGGIEAGHKGYALSLLIEALTGGLAGHGRADPKEGMAATVFLQVLDPEAFGGLADFKRQTDWIVDACHANPPRPGVERVRLPGENGLKRRVLQQAAGVELHPGILPALAPWSVKLGVPAPAAL